MKKYMTPEMEVVKLKAQSALLSMSSGSADVTDPNEPERD